MADTNNVSIKLRFPSSQFSFLSLIFAAALAVFTGSAAHAQAVQLSAPPAGQSAAVTAAYPAGTPDPNYDNVQFLYGPFTVAAGNNDVTFTATQTAAANDSGKSFETFTNDGSLDFPVGTELVDTAAANNHQDGSSPTGPLLINFSSGVAGFGLNAQDNASDTEMFTYTVYTNLDPTVGTTFQTGAFNTASQSVFLGAQSVGDLITSVLINSESVAVDNGMISTANSNDFYVGPLSTYAPVPEASTTVSFGLLLVLGLGGAAAARRKQILTVNNH